MEGNIVDIPAATFQETYSGYRVTYTFVPELKQWRWEFEISYKPIRHYDMAVNRQAAIKAAHKQIDKLSG